MTKSKLKPISALLSVRWPAHGVQVDLPASMVPIHETEDKAYFAGVLLNATGDPCGNLSFTVLGVDGLPREGQRGRKPNIARDVGVALAKVLLKRRYGGISQAVAEIVSNEWFPGITQDSHVHRSVKKAHDEIESCKGDSLIVGDLIVLFDGPADYRVVGELLRIEGRGWFWVIGKAEAIFASVRLERPSKGLHPWFLGMCQK